MKSLPVAMYERNAFVVRAKVSSTEWVQRVARELGHRPEDIMFVNEVSVDGLAFRPLVNADMLNLLYEDLEPGTIYTVGGGKPLYLRRSIVIIGHTDGILTARPAIARPLKCCGAWNPCRMPDCVPEGPNG